MEIRQPPEQQEVRVFVMRAYQQSLARFRRLYERLADLNGR